MKRLFIGLLRGLLLRCPRCGRGRVLTGYFAVAVRCAACGLAYEPAAGEITGAMGINLVLTLVIALAAAVTIGFSRTLPLLPSVLVMVAVVVAFRSRSTRSRAGCGSRCCTSPAMTKPRVSSC